jgi:hypothetical protein
MLLKGFVLSGCALIALAFNSSVEGALFFADGFDYANGQLTTFDGTTAFAGNNVSGGNWVTYSPVPPSAINPGSITVANGKAILNEPSTEDAERSVPNAATEFQTPGETWYYSALVTVLDERPSLATAITKEYFMLVKDTSQAALRARLYVDNPTVAGTAGYRLAIGASSGAANAVNFPTDLAFGTEYKVVVSYAHDTGFSQLWVNPTSTLSPSVTGVLGASPGTFVSALGLRQAFFGGGAANTEIHIDGVRFGDTFADVASIPEPATVALSALGLVGIALASRRRIA